jgi:monoamine oxidase
MKVIVVGAGAAGLSAAVSLVAAGVEVVVVEALDRIGGRIHTYIPPGFTFPVEAGAEFIHGNLPLTMDLLQDAGQQAVRTSGKMFSFQNGQPASNFGEANGWDEFIDEMNELVTDCPVGSLLDKKFGGQEYQALRKEVRSMAQGLDLADITKLSVFSVRDEWSSHEKQYRPADGYSGLVGRLHRKALSSRLYSFHLNETAQEISWSAESVTIKTQNRILSGDKVLLTLPVSAYLRKDIRFFPPIPKTIELFNAIGFGSVVKIALEFSTAFWFEAYPEMGFLFLDEGFTFWTQSPEEKPLLIAWLGNDYAEEYGLLSDDELIGTALKKLWRVFGEKIAVENEYKAGAVFRYTRTSHFGGGYSWLTPDSLKAIEFIQAGVSDALWFAGEALASDGAVALVETALQSGQDAARRMIECRK